MKKHLVIASDLFSPSIGGTETVTKNMAEELSKYYRITVVAPAIKTKQAPYLERHKNYQILRVRSIGVPIQQNLRFAHKAYDQIATYFDRRENKVDIIHANNPFPLSKMMLRYAKHTNVPMISGSHLMPESFTTFLRKLGEIHIFIDDAGWRRFARFYNKTNAVVAPTKTALRYLLESGLNVPTYAISNGIDLHTIKPYGKKQQLRHELGLKSQYIMIYAGRLGVEKRVDVVIDAFAQLVSKFDIELVLVGDGNATKKLKKRVKRLKLQDKVKFTGYVQDTTLKHKYLQAADIFAIASPVELQSIVTLEAMTAGLPVFACNEGALPELAQRGKNGDTFRDGDAKQLARKIGRVLLDPVLLRRYSRASLQMIAQHDIRNTWLKYHAMYEEVYTRFYHKHKNS